MIQTLRKIISKKKYYTTNKGSTPIVLSAIVSLAILSTIYINQENVDWFTTTHSKNSADWQYNLTASMALGIGGYLVSNNFILCKQGTWSNNYGASCKWNSHTKHTPAEFFKNTQSSRNPLVTVGNKKLLSFAGKIDKTLINDNENDVNIEYDISFDILHWKDTSLHALIGEIPSSYCRHRYSKVIITGTCTLPTSATTTTNNIHHCSDTAEDIKPEDTVCEFINTVDADYNIVFMTVTVKDANNVVQLTKHGAIRRPLATPVITVVEQPKCPLACPSSATTGLEECRGNMRPLSGENNTKLKIKVHNNGPGIIYSLKLQKKETILTTDNQGITTIPGENTKSITPELIKADILLPGNFVYHETLVDCRDQIKYFFNLKRGARGKTAATVIAESIRKKRYAANGIEEGITPQFKASGITNNNRAVTIQDVNVHAQPFLKVSFELLPYDSPGVCMLNHEVIAGECTNRIQNCGVNNTGTCEYSYLEPQRSMAILDFNLKKLVTKITTTTTTINLIPPH